MNENNKEDIWTLDALRKAMDKSAELQEKSIPIKNIAVPQKVPGIAISNVISCFQLDFTTTFEYNINKLNYIIRDNQFQTLTTQQILKLDINDEYVLNRTYNTFNVNGTQILRVCWPELEIESTGYLTKEGMERKFPKAIESLNLENNTLQMPKLKGPLTLLRPWVKFLLKLSNFNYKPNTK